MSVLLSRCWSRCPAVLLVALFAPVLLTGQNFDATHLAKPVELDGTWLVQSGDQSDYARPDLDDSHWLAFNLNKSIDTAFSERPSIIWYRERVRIDPGVKGLALDEANISQACEIYVNGERLLKIGNIDPFVPYTMQAPVLVPIPERLTISGLLLIAVRVHISRPEWQGQFPGLYVTNLSIGQESSLYNANWLTVIGGSSLEWIDKLMLVGVGLIALVLFASQRRETVYLWIFAVGALTLVEFPVPFISHIRNIPMYWQVVGTLPRLLSPFLWVSLYFAFVHQKVGWIWRGILIFAGIANFISGILGWAITLPFPLGFMTSLPYISLLSIVIPIVLIVHWRRGNPEAGILMVPAIFFSLYIYAEIGLDVLFQFPAWRQGAIRGLNLIDRYPVGPFSISLNNISDILSTIALAIIMVQRSAAMSRRQAQMDTELEAAREVQRVLVPEHRGVVPGFDVETVYEPAQQVGGDFFQFIPTGDGGLLIVVGDVAGKGLPAAMLVSVLVGAICGLSEYTKDPAELLAGLNERLVGRSGGGFSTALAAHFAPDGPVRICNAGHLAPYLDGNEVELAGALPLGIASSTLYETTQIHLNPGSRLTFYSDGVIEAQRPNGELFGFDRAREISVRPAAQIVETAKGFGQQDDITVVSITRVKADEARATEKIGDALLRPQSV